MSGNTFGLLYCVTSFGESHGPAYGGVIDGCPPGLALSEADIQRELDRRKPGTSRHVTQRQESDRIEILSATRTSARRTTARSPTPSAPATPTTRTGRSTACATTAAAGAPRRARR